jgi:hypothetical protein
MYELFRLETEPVALSGKNVVVGGLGCSWTVPAKVRSKRLKEVKEKNKQKD